MRKQNLFEIILRRAVVAVRPVAFGCLGFHELLVDLGLRTPHMLGEIDEGGQARELRNGAAQFGFRSDLDQRKKPRHDGADAHRNRIDAENREIRRRFLQLSLRRPALAAPDHRQFRAGLVDERQLHPCVGGHPWLIRPVLLHIRHRRER